MPQSLAVFKRNILIIFTILLATSIAILSTNLEQEAKFKSDLAFIEIIKNIKNTMDRTVLSTMYMYTISNNQGTNLSNLDLFPFASNNLFDFFQSQVGYSVSQLETYLTTMTQASEASEAGISNILADNTT